MKNRIRDYIFVFLILAVVSIIVSPVFSESKLLADKSLCMERLKNLGFAIMLYGGDNNNTFPLARNSKSGTWQQVIIPYVAEGECFFCPSSKNVPDYSQNVSWNVLNRSLGRNYGANTKVMGDGENDITLGQYPARVYETLPSPENTVMIFDAGSYIEEPAERCFASALQYLPGFALAGSSCPDFGEDYFAKMDFAKGRHDQGINIMFSDCHGEFHKSKEMGRLLRNKKNNPFDPDSWRE